MAGLIAYGAYVPYHRLKRSEIAAGPRGGRGQGHPRRRLLRRGPHVDGRRGRPPRPARRPPPRLDLGALLFATANPPYLDKTNANVVHAALALDPGALAVDVVGSVRSGIGALLLAAESPTPTLAVLADVRTGLPGGADERDGGDAAAAFLFGDGAPVIAEVVAQASATEEFLDRWRLPGAAASQRVGGALRRARLRAPRRRRLRRRAEAGRADARARSTSSWSAGTHGRAVRALRRAVRAWPGSPTTSRRSSATPARPTPGFVLADVLDEAEPGQTIALVVLADGATAVVLRTTDAIAAYRRSARRRRPDRRGRRRRCATPTS